MIALEQEYLSQVAIRQQDFDRTLGTKTPLLSGYNPVLERAKVEWLRNGGGDKIAERKAREEIRENITTALAEYFKVSGGQGYLKVINSELHSDRDDHEPVVASLRRGVIYREYAGSQDQKRESAEIVGWEEITGNFVSGRLPEGTKIISLSPPSQVPGSPYQERYIDEFEVVDVDDSRKIRRRRTAVDFCLEDYEALALTLDPSYFDDYKRESVDAWFLSHPIVCSSGPISEIPIQRIVGYPPKQFEKVLEANRFFAEAHLEALFAPETDWKYIALTFNAFLKNAIDVKSIIDKNQKDILAYKPTRAEVTRIGLEPIAKILAGCGAIGGFGFAAARMVENSVAQFGENWTYHLGNCRICPRRNVDVGPCEICKICEKKF